MQREHRRFVISDPRAKINSYTCNIWHMRNRECAARNNADSHIYTSVYNRNQDNATVLSRTNLDNYTFASAARYPNRRGRTCSVFCFRFFLWARDALSPRGNNPHCSQQSDSSSKWSSQRAVVAQLTRDDDRIQCRQLIADARGLHVVVTFERRWPGKMLDVVSRIPQQLYGAITAFSIGAPETFHHCWALRRRWICFTVKNFSRSA